MNALSLPVVHPTFQNLRKSNRLLHLVAAIIIVFNSFHEFSGQHPWGVYFWSQMIIAVDLIILVFFGRVLLNDSPNTNLIFRLIQIIIFTASSILYFEEAYYGPAIVMGVLSVFYSYIFYCEKKSITSERLGFFHLGIEVPDFPGNRIFYWHLVEKVEASYEMITIFSFNNKYSYHFQQNLSFNELDQIHDFCSYYLKQKV